MKAKKIITILLIVTGMLTLSNRYRSSRIEKIVENNKITYTINQQQNYNQQQLDKNKSSLDTDDLYDGILSIPQINLKKGIYKKDDIRNNIEDNVTIHKSSTYPDNASSNIILIAHSGTGKKAFFNNIDKLTKDSLIEFYYHGTKYVYKIDKNYQVLKNGTVLIDRNEKNKTITLITCVKNDKTKQLVYIGYLIDEIKI